MSLIQFPRFNGVRVLRARNCPNFIELCQVQIAPDHQGRGVGSAILDYLKSVAHDYQKPIRLQAVAPEAKNQRRLESFYRMHGFKKVAGSPLPNLMEWTL